MKWSRRSAIRFYRQAQRWSLRQRGDPLYIVLIVVFVACIIALFWPSMFRLCLATADRVVLFVGLLTGTIVWWQGHLIRRQMELSTTVSLYAEWNSKEMLRNRNGAWVTNKPNPDTIERVLEFLEKISTLEREGFISRGSIWDTFGWYLWRYYFYCKDVIEEMRHDWTPKAPDLTLYKHLEDLYPKLLHMELAERNCYGSTDALGLTEADI